MKVYRILNKETLQKMSEAAKLRYKTRERNNLGRFK